MHLADYIVLGGIVAAAVLVIAWIICRRKRGGGCGQCGGNCRVMR